MTEEQIRNVIARFSDPVLKNDFSTLGFIKNISLKGTSLSLVLGISDMDSTKLDGITDEMRKTLEAEFPNLEKIEIEFKPAILTHKNQKKSILMPDVKNTIAIS